MPRQASLVLDSGKGEPLLFNCLMSKPNMKNTTPTDRRVLVDPALIQAHSSVYRAMADIRLAAKIIRKQHNRQQEPNRPDEYNRIEGLMQAMLFDIQRMIGCETMRQFQNLAHNNSTREGRL